MESHSHTHEESGRSALVFAVAANAGLAAVELFAGSHALQMDVAHNVADTGAHAGRLVATNERYNGRVRNAIRRGAAILALAGTAFVGARATQELVSQEADEPNKFAVPTALASWGLQYVVHKKLHPHRQRSGAHADAAQHAHIDAITAPIILTGVLAAELGYTHADPAAALVAGVFVARSNIEILRSLRKNGAD